MAGAIYTTAKWREKDKYKNRYAIYLNPQLYSGELLAIKT